MLSRRELIAGGAGIHMAGGGAAAAQQQAGGDSDSARALRSISDILDSIRAQTSWAG